MNMQVLDARRDLSGGYKVDVTRGERVGRVSSEWFSRPDDERVLALDPSPAERLWLERRMWTLVAAAGVESAAAGVRSSIPNWRTRQDSNL